MSRAAICSCLPSPVSGKAVRSVEVPSAAVSTRWFSIERPIISVPGLLERVVARFGQQAVDRPRQRIAALRIVEVEAEPPAR